MVLHAGLDSETHLCRTADLMNSRFYLTAFSDAIGPNLSVK
jgi:hypothetical protein